MLYKTSTLKGYALNSLDGEIGKAEEFYFEDQQWTIRYLVADTGTWLPRRQVLLSPHALVAVKQKEKQIEVKLTKQQIEDSPSLSSDKPVSRQFEEAYYGHYGWPTYWNSSDVWGASPFIVPDPAEPQALDPAENELDPHLRSTRAVRGYHIEAEDGPIGHIEDFILDDETWTIRYLIIDTVSWWPGKKVLVATRWIDRVSWEESKVFIDLPRETIKQAPEYKDDLLLDRNYETSLHEHYSRLGYWNDKNDAAKKSH